MTTQPAGEHHTGTLNLAGEGNEAEVVSDELVVAVTKAQHQLTDDEWHGMSDSVREYASTGIRRGLTAALPALRRQIAEEIAAKADEIADGHQKSAEAHRALALEKGSAEPQGQRHMRTAHSFKDQAAGAWEVAHAAREIGGEA